MTETSWAGMNPNSDHQLWSYWRFTITPPSTRRATFEDVKLNAARWLRSIFGTGAAARVTREPVAESSARSWLYDRYVIELFAEGAVAQDPVYVLIVERAFSRFVESGWGPLARATVEARVVAGNADDGKPPCQLVVLPDLPELSRAVKVALRLLGGDSAPEVPHVHPRGTNALEAPAGAPDAHARRAP